MSFIRCRAPYKALIPFSPQFFVVGYYSLRVIEGLEQCSERLRYMLKVAQRAHHRG